MAVLFEPFFLRSSDLSVKLPLIATQSPSFESRLDLDPIANFPA